MSNRGVRVLIAAVGAFAVGRGAGQLSELLKLICVLFAGDISEVILPDWITALAVTSPLALVVLGVVLLVRPPAWLMDRLCASDSVAGRLRGVSGVFLVTVAVEQLQRFSAASARATEHLLYWAPAVGYALLVLTGLVVPVGLGTLGVALILRAGRTVDVQAGGGSAGSEAEHVSLADLWSIAAVLAGAVLLALALPELPNIVAYIGFAYQPAARFDSEWVALSTWTMLLSFLVQVGIGAYLLAGAPRFVRWHLAKLGSQTEP